MKYNRIREKKLKQTTIVRILGITPMCMLVMAIILAFNNGGLFQLIKDYFLILGSSSILMTDFIEVGRMQGALLNSAIMGFFVLAFYIKYKIKISGTLIAAFYMVVGFSFFGKNILNVIPIFIGGYLYVKYQKMDFREVLAVMLFGMSLAPIVSEIIYGGFIARPYSYFVAIFFGIFIGFILTPLSSHMLKFHEGFNLYNMGFAAGIVGTLMTSILRANNIKVDAVNILFLENNFFLIAFLLINFSLLFFIGLYINPRALKKYKNIFKYKGRLVTDFPYLLGYGVTLINMSIMGIFSTLFVLAIGGVINGPVLAAIFTVMGFSAFGKHLKNTIPVMIGVILMAFILKLDIRSTSVILAILFSTGLAPISGTYGITIGILGGMLHLILVKNVGVIHGGVNLYNNGFAAGIVAAVIVPIMDALKRGEEQVYET